MCYTGGVTCVTMVLQVLCGPTIAVQCGQNEAGTGAACVTLVVLMCHDGVTGSVWAHHCCAMWSETVDQTDGRLRYVDRAVFNGLSQVSHAVFITL